MSTLFDDTDLRAETERDLPELRGSEAQVKWAKHVRSKAFWEIDQLLREWRLLIDRYRDLGNTEAAERESQLRAEALDVMGRLEQENRSWVWIDGREWTARQWLSGELPERSGYGR